ncbi:MAG TPA: Panacea domain-containing protein [Tepidisphaeraceae bacterium]|nr:Panacea domain-containing protein [Tepidisphaeraceae bacterium]
MLIPFHPLKVAQAAVVLLKTEPARRMSRLRLLKLLYIADREALTERARPITGDRPVAMDHGPVLSHTYDLIKGRGFSSPVWEQYLRPVSRDIELVADPGVGRLTRYEIKKLQEVAERFADVDDWSVAEYTHNFAEWQKNQPPKGSSKNIPLDDLLEATGKLVEKSQLLVTEQAEMAFDRVLAAEAQ